jgi:hypothetical protein
MTDSRRGSAPLGGERSRYEISVEGLLDQRWSAWFDGLQITSQPGSGVTVIAGQVADQAALHGLLAKICDLGLPLISLRRIDPA